MKTLNFFTVAAIVASTMVSCSTDNGNGSSSTETQKVEIQRPAESDTEAKKQLGKFDSKVASIMRSLRKHKNAVEDSDDKMYGVIKKYQCVYIVMHIQGTPATMQNDPSYHNVITEVVKKLSEIKFKLVKDGVNDIIIDPGFGFGKSIEQNYEILNKLAQFKLLGLPILVGFSRKSMIYKVLQQEAKDALNGTSVLNTFALLNGANIIRVHDVKEAKECAILVSKLKANSI
jgi:dihydropteroate synthase